MTLGESMRRSSVLLLLSFAVACNKEVTDPPELPEEATVEATTNRQFLPSNAPIRRGGTVTWEAQTLTHQVLFDVRAGAPPNIAELPPGASESRDFTTAGQYTYRCGLHPEMIGTITVIEP